MTGASIELQYSLYAHEVRYVMEDLALESAMGEDQALKFSLHPLILVSFIGFMAVHWIHWLFYRLPGLWLGELEGILISGEVISHLFGLLTSVLLGELIVKLVRRRLSRDVQGGKGVIWGAHRLLATSEHLKVSLAEVETVYHWTAILECRNMDDMLYLMLSPREAVAIPERAFDSEEEQHAFQDFVEDQIAGADAGPWGKGPKAEI